MAKWTPFRSRPGTSRSRTSVALLRILLKAKYGITPEFVTAAPDLDAMMHRADAALLIGDPVLPLVETGEDDEGRHSLDLGQEWNDFSGTPFVFAFWAGGDGMLSSTQVARLQRARREGEQHVSDIAVAFQRERAATMAMTIHASRDGRMPCVAAASSAPLSAKGRAKMLCSNLIIRPYSRTGDSMLMWGRIAAAGCR